MKKILLLTSIAFCQSIYAQQTQTPDQVYGQLYKDVQEQAVFADSKTFVDCTPKKSPAIILADYLTKKKAKNFDLKKFVANNFAVQAQPKVTNTDKSKDIVTHINDLWKILQRSQDKKITGSSLLALPKPYIVPGGRFTEVYYWDSYFTMLGLKEAKEYTTIENMIDNFAYLINTYGHIPNGNRSYYLSRSQPPFFAMMVKLLASIKGDAVYKKYLPALQKEYNFWMDGIKNLNKETAAYKRVVKTEDGTILNRYCDDLDIPRQEGHKEDMQTAEAAASYKMRTMRFANEKAMNNFILQNTKLACKDLRSAAESGWDFSSRWFSDANNIATIQTTNIVPVDLNCLLLVLEDVLLKNGGKIDKTIANNRINAIDKYFWNKELGFYCDYNFYNFQNTGIVTAAGMFPLAVNAVNGSPEYLQPKMDAIVKIVTDKLLKPGGIVCTETNNGQQWDAPNGWAPLQWMTIKGLENYHKKELAKDIAMRWMALNEKVYTATGKLTEKYNVVDLSIETGGGEYPNLDGFGWTNGVYLALYNKYKRL